MSSNKSIINKRNSYVCGFFELNNKQNNPLDVKNTFSSTTLVSDLFSFFSRTKYSLFVLLLTYHLLSIDFLYPKISYMIYVALNNGLLAEPNTYTSLSLKIVLWITSINSLFIYIFLFKI